MFTVKDRPAYNPGLDEPGTAMYRCECGYEKEVVVEYDLFSKCFFPMSIKDALCGNTECKFFQTEMDRV
jgi:hypothetical protein